MPILTCRKDVLDRGGSPGWVRFCFGQVGRQWFIHSENSGERANWQEKTPHIPKEVKKVP
jgi:hypothetical protein